MAIYSIRLGAKHDVDISNPLSYVVPAGHVVVVRCIDAFSAVLTGNELFVELHAVPAVVFFQASWAINETGWRNWRGRQVFEAADELLAFSNDALDVYISGYLLTV